MTGTSLFAKNYGGFWEGGFMVTETSQNADEEEGETSGR